MTIDSISVEHDAKNKENVFSRGDSITGRVVLVISKETKVERLSVKAKGKASVLWSEHYGSNIHVTYHSKDKYFSIEKYVLEETGRVLTPGSHVFPFEFDIPHMDLPSSFKGKYGKIKYVLEARAARSMRTDSKAKTEFTVLSKEDVSIPDIKVSQQRSSEKSLKLFSSGNVALNVHTERMGYLQGDHLKIKAEIINSSSRTVTPKYYLYEKQCFYAKGRRKVYTKNILMEKGESARARTQLNETKVFQIPQLLPATIFNCSILKLEYRLKVVLHVTMHSNPEIKLPIVVLADPDGTESKRLQEETQRESLFW